MLSAMRIAFVGVMLKVGLLLSLDSEPESLCDETAYGDSPLLLQTSYNVSALLPGAVQPTKPSRNASMADCAVRTVFDVGLPRTGTTSASAFLEKVGFTSFHYLWAPTQEVQSCRNKTSACEFYKPWGAGSDSLSVAFEDVPTPWLSCSLALNFPDAKFIYTTRPVEDYLPSNQWMLCRSITHHRCFYTEDLDGLKPGDAEMTEAMLYGDGYSDFCSMIQDRPSLCDEDGRSTLAQKEWETAGLNDKFRSHYLQHDAEVRNCVPADRLLEVHLGANDSASRIHQFLGCHGEVPPFPSLNAASSS